jgi:hypothetical protein
MADPLSRLEFACSEIDRVLGPGTAKANPDLVAAVMQSAATDFAATAIARAITDVAAALVETGADNMVDDDHGIVRAGGLLRP